MRSFAASGLPLALVASLSALLTGCGTDQYARMLVEPNTTYGQLNEALMASSPQLVRSGTVALAPRITMPDGTEIDAWILTANVADGEDPRGTVMVLHGLADAKVSYLALGRMLAERGFDVVLPDLRAHGRSGGEYVTYGAREKLDLLRVMDELYDRERVAEPLYVVGADVGGMTAIQYAAIDPRVEGVLALAAPLDMAVTADRMLRRVAPLLTREEVADAINRAGDLAGFDPAEASALRAIEQVRVPVILSHGRLDAVVPFSDSEQRRAAAGGPVELVAHPLLGHVGLLLGRDAAIAARVERLAAGRVGVSATTQPSGR